jgi:hypothetical protein
MTEVSVERPRSQTHDLLHYSSSRPPLGTSSGGSGLHCASADRIACQLSGWRPLACGRVLPPPVGAAALTGSVVFSSGPISIPLTGGRD